MITREEFADLRAGDFVEITTLYPGVTTRGPLRSFGGRRGVALGTFIIRNGDGTFSFHLLDRLTVISRVPRLYVNSDRTEPVPGDVVRDADDDSDRRCWDYIGNLNTGSPWARVGCIGWDTRRERDNLPARLRLLVDGETGQVAKQ